MRILLVHNEYRRPGGEDAVVANEHRLLSERGHAARVGKVTNADISGWTAKARVAWRTPYHRQSRSWLAGKIRDFAPDIVHIHNFFPLLTPAIYDACLDAGVAVVQTLHNYRTTCANGLLLRDGQPCENCISGSPYQAVLHRCYRNSFIGSWSVARMIQLHRLQNTWRDKVTRFVALTQFARSKLVEAGLPAEKIVVKPNFVPDPGPLTKDARQGALFVGRLAPEKGIATLLRAWVAVDALLTVVGDGPLRRLVETSGNRNVKVLGWKSSREVSAEMRRAAVLIMPSEWYEMAPLTLIEAFAHGLPVIASRLGAMAEVVQDGVTGLHFAPGSAEDLAEKVRWAISHPSELKAIGDRARLEYEKKYTPEANYRLLMATYEAAIKESSLSFHSHKGTVQV